MYYFALASCLAVLLSFVNPGEGSSLGERGVPICRRTKVAVLGAGMTGIIAAQVGRPIPCLILCIHELTDT